MKALRKGDLIQTDTGLFYVMDINPTKVQSMTGGPIHKLKDSYTWVCHSSTEEKEEFTIPTKIRNFIKECLSL